MRQIKLTGREATIVRAIGFTESMLGTEIQDHARMESEDLTDTLNGLLDHRTGRAEQVERCTPPFGEPGDVVEQVGGCDALGKCGAGQQPRGEHQRHAVGVNEVGGKE